MPTGALDVTEAFNRLLAENPDEAAEFLSPSPVSPGRAMGEFVELGYRLDEWRHTVTPQILSRSAIEFLERGVRAVMAGVDHLLRATFEDDPGKAAEALRIERWKTGLLHVARRQDWARIARPDVIWHGDIPRLLELNAGTWLGGLGESDLLARALVGWPRAEHFLKEAGVCSVDTVSSLAAHISATERLRAGDLVVIAYWADGRDNMPPVFRRALESQVRRGGLNAVVAPVEELDLTGRHVTLEGKRVAALYRFFEEVEDDHPERAGRWRRLLDHIAAGRVVLVGDFVGDVFANKTLLAMLSEAADSGTVPNAADVRNVLPWTRLLADGRTTRDGAPIDLLDHCSRHRDGLVLKPVDGYGGADVAFGATMAESEWARSIERALDDDRLWVVQRFIPSETERLAFFQDGQMRTAPARSVTGAFFVDRRFAGGIRRWATSELNVNPVCGSGEGSVFVR
ncbi:circularly permuted type 2 ATP-grasp protein [Actinomadura decatromicini]|uniref:Circularly permuted type 2 ATP-grasp protein n=1 Tax=Actinomadura decatromicini TaxID=2604572 RepID=A0A5D3FY13_9ACTN|nr:circularly permuted type 2 ATP-grasp protein [Actinomadura decatromicini]TYK53221.1 circularly permuted type 2 ATP-grasp protein [Actinomadura decatromicini]